MSQISSDKLEWFKRKSLFCQKNDTSKGEIIRNIHVYIMYNMFIMFMYYKCLAQWREIELHMYRAYIVTFNYSSLKCLANNGAVILMKNYIQDFLRNTSV